MWVWARITGLLGLSMLLMGSKLIIEVPQGGSIESSTGLFACTAGEVCTIEINKRQFAETFTAVAEPGYVFHSWVGSAGAVCRGSRDTYCAELDRDAFFDSRGDSVQVRPGSVLTMSPSFTADEHPPAETKSRFRVSSLQSTRYYEVGGNTQEQVWAQLHGAANPLANDLHAGTKQVAQADFHYRYDFNSELGADPSDCRVATGKLAFKFETVLPRLAVRQKTSVQLKDRWRSFQERVIEHEAGHHAIYRQLVTQLPELLTQVGEVPCAELTDTVAMAVAGAVDAVRQASVDYDDYHSTEAYAASSL